MRIWHPIPPFCLDRQRLLGEHRELHAIWSILTRGKKGYRNHPEVKRWRNHLAEFYLRHDLLVEEMERRGYNHKSQLFLSDLSDCPWVQIISWPETWEPIETMRTKLAEKQNIALDHDELQREE